MTIEIKVYISEKRLFGDYEEIKLNIDTIYNIKKIKLIIQKNIKKILKEKSQ